MESCYQDLNEYDFRHLFSHFKEDGLDVELHEMLVEYDWLYSKLNATEINALLDDYELIEGDETLNLVRDALRLSAYVLTQDKSKLAFQLLGRMLDFEQPEIQNLMEQIKNWKSDHPWLRPITSCLPPLATGPSAPSRGILAL